MKHVVSELREAIAEDGPILIGMGVIWSSLVILLALKGVNGLEATSYGGNLLLYTVPLVVIGLAFLIRLFYRVRPESPIRFLLTQIGRTEWLALLVRGLPMLIALIVFMPVFSAMKSAIPLFNEYNWDSTWVAADRAIHGMDAWKRLQPVLGYPLVTSLLSVAYHAWLFLIYAGSTYFCFFAKDRELRARYFIAFFGIWTIIGVVMATGFASVGPCFLSAFTGDNSFDEQMAYLRSANDHYPVLVLSVQQMLLEWHQTASHGLGSGITAMPSMHVSMALLFALSIAKVSKPAGIAAFVFFGIIALASVHLAYHYAVDGYVSAATTLAIWAVSKPLARLSVRKSRGWQASHSQPLHPGIATA